MIDFSKKVLIRIAAIILFIGFFYAVVFSLDFGFNKFPPLIIVFKSLIYLFLGTYLFHVLLDIVSSIQERLKNLEIKEGKKRYWKEIKIYYLIAFTAITVWVSQTLVEFLLSMLIAGLITLLIVLMNNFKIVRKNNKKEG